ncbi:hypothetical protein CANARDRAFT_7629 [[Candida] arabinofermentans NRRL YB-2248]|uniref:Telomere replication protein EST3 n=1 Tax=[Candida] arabinofermentans NRRL YB-2248 TaxID=983967 RepID=A0A1E4T1B7_9ASCO|nr:hypothetical protein CANARDRAFT_7629 [[Candida] arabinofermentans NRRL YB-2248]
MPKSLREKSRVVSSVFLKDWLSKVLCPDLQDPHNYSIKHLYKYDDGKVLKVLRLFNHRRSKANEELALSLCDSNYKILGVLTPEAISNYELSERRRVSMNLLNTEIIIRKFKVRFLNDHQIQERFDGLKLVSDTLPRDNDGDDDIHNHDEPVTAVAVAGAVAGTAAAKTGSEIYNADEINHILRYAIIEIYDFSAFSRDQVILNNAHRIPFIYQQSRYRARFFTISQMANESTVNVSQANKQEEANENVTSNEMVEIDDFPLF